MLRKSDWDIQKPGIIISRGHRLVQKAGQQSLKRPATDSETTDS